MIFCFAEKSDTQFRSINPMAINNPPMYGRHSFAAASVT